MYLPRMIRGNNGQILSFELVSLSKSLYEMKYFNLSLIDEMFMSTTNYKGSLEFEETMKSLGHQLLALPRKLPINKFPEGKW